MTTTSNLNNAPSGSVTISGPEVQGQVLRATNNLDDADGFGQVTYQWQADGRNISGATGDALLLTQAHVDAAITVVASYTDQRGTVESVPSPYTRIVANVNDVPTGAVTISGPEVQGQVLRATNNLNDIDGLGSITYQWQADGRDIFGATSDSLLLTQAHVDAAITVVASYTDRLGTVESVPSPYTRIVANVNDIPTGSVTISGPEIQGQVLRATNNLNDADGMGWITYQWQADGRNIGGATSDQLLLTQAHVDAAITVVASYIDQRGTAESVPSPYTRIVANVNDVPTGSVTISGLEIQGQVLRATNNLNDADGLGWITYQWQADGRNIGGATSDQLLLTQAHVDAAITVVASYVDQRGTVESVPSAYTKVVEAVVSATYSIPISSIDSIGLSSDGQYLLIKVGGITQSVPVGSSLSFNGSTVTTSDLTSSITVQPVFQSSGGSNGYALPEAFTGPASLNLDYQLIETGYNAVVIGGATNDFIKVASTNSTGKAVDGGAGDDVIDGGVGSTFISGGTGSDTIFLDGRASGTSWSTVTDFTFGQDKATIWGWKAGVSKVSTLFTDFNTGGAAGYTGLTLHFENLLPDDAAAGQTNSNFNSITLSRLTLADFGATSLEDLNAQINAGTNSHFIVGQTTDAYGDHGYLFLS